MIQFVEEFRALVYVDCTTRESVEGETEEGKEEMSDGRGRRDARQIQLHPLQLSRAASRGGASYIFDLSTQDSPILEPIRYLFNQRP